MNTKVQKWGNSLALRIPRSIACQAGLSCGDEVDVTLRDDHIRVEARNDSPRDATALLRGVTPGNRHEESDWGPQFAGRHQ